MLYPAELRGRRGFSPFMGAAGLAQAEQNGANGHRAARWRHIFGHSEGEMGRPRESFTYRATKRARGHVDAGGYHNICLRIDPETFEELSQAALAQGCSFNAQALMLIEVGLETIKAQSA